VAAAAWFGPAGGAFIALLIAIGLVSTVSAMTWAGPRVAQAMGRDHRAFGFLAATSPAGVPVRAVLLQYVLALLLIFSSDVEEIMVRTEFVLQLFLLLTVWGVIQLRMRQPGLTRPYRAWGYPFSTVGFLVATAMIMGMTLHHRPAEAQWGIGLVAIGVLVHFLARRPGDGRDGPGGKTSTSPEPGP
jgi:APA family basic amino acid/polyamine antiporter